MSFTQGSNRSLLAIFTICLFFLIFMMWVWIMTLKLFSGIAWIWPEEISKVRVQITYIESFTTHRKGCCRLLSWLLAISCNHLLKRTYYVLKLFGVRLINQNLILFSLLDKIMYWSLVRIYKLLWPLLVGAIGRLSNTVLDIS